MRLHMPSRPWRELADYQPLMQKRLPDLWQTFLHISLCIRRLAPRGNARDRTPETSDYSPEAAAASSWSIFSYTELLDLYSGTISFILRTVSMLL